MSVSPTTLAPITLPAKPPLPWKAYLAAAVLAGLLWWSARDTGVSWGAIVSGLPDIAGYFRKLFPSPGNPWPYDYLPDIRFRMTETLKLGFAGGFWGAVLALPFALVGSRNLAATRFAYGAGRAFLNFVRTVPELVLAVLFASMFSIGPFPGFLALVIFSWGVVSKLLCDTIETIDTGPTEAIAACGGSRLQQAVFAVLPQVAPDYFAYALYAFEINIRTAAVLGLVGAGGIGVILSQNISTLNYGRVGLIIAVTFVIVFIIDTFSTWLRSRLV